MLNRFGKVRLHILLASMILIYPQDVETIDTSLARSLQNVNSSLATFFAAILTVA